MSIEDKIQDIGYKIFSDSRKCRWLRLKRFFNLSEWFIKITGFHQYTKIKLLQFTSSLPFIHDDSRRVIQNLREYLTDGKAIWFVRIPIAIFSIFSFSARLVIYLVENVMARRFFIGEDREEALEIIEKMKNKRRRISVDVLGEISHSQEDTDAYIDEYIHLLDHGVSNISIKLTNLYSELNPVAWQRSRQAIKNNLMRLVEQAKRRAASITIDMEYFGIKDLTIEVFLEVLEETGFKNLSIAIQCYFKNKESLRDLQQIVSFSKERSVIPGIRLVKGANWDKDMAEAIRMGWPVPHYWYKAQTDISFEEGARYLLENIEYVRPYFGTHNIRSMAWVIACAEELGIPKERFEFQFLYGMIPEEIVCTIEQLGYNVRFYVPYGRFLPGLGYLVRRILENSSNESFLHNLHYDKKSIDKLLLDPRKISPIPRCPSLGSVSSVQSVPGQENEYRYISRENGVVMAKTISENTMRKGFVESFQVRGGLPGFSNIPAVEFYRPQNQLEMKEALMEIKKSYHPENVHFAEPVDVERAVDSAKGSFKQWSAFSVEERAKVLKSAAGIMTERRFMLASLIVLEVKKSQQESLFEVDEAIDFLNYYAIDAIRIQNEHREGFERSPNGVCVVISPWNFPLSILTGMAAGALVMGNTVIMKPSEYSPIIAKELMNIFIEAGIPSGVLNYLPGKGESIGELLVSHPEVNMVAFTGSKEVGLRIKEKGPEVVIAEMGGKNAIIVDSDADIDEAVEGIIVSAFGYSGQKCSACSRVIVLSGIEKPFGEKLKAKFQSMIIGDPMQEPDVLVGPLINMEAKEKVGAYLEIAKKEGLELLTSRSGYDVTPVIYRVRDYKISRLAREEIFGPILVLIYAKDFDEALQIANDSEFALTGGLYSQTPSHIQRAKDEFFVGNLYINQKITGAIVGRQPFGGFKNSGIGNKTGGPDYLYQFTHWRKI